LRGGGIPRPSISISGGSVDYFEFSSATPEGSDPEEGISSFSIGKVPFSFSVDPAPEILESPWAARQRYAGPLLYSLFIHSIILLLLLAVLYQPDRRPVKEVSHWVINLVSAAKEAPQGPKTLLPEESHILAGPVQPAPEPPAPVSAGEKTSPDGSVPSFQEFPLTAEVGPESPTEESLPAPPLSETKNAEGAILAMQENAGNQLLMGQYLFRMRMGDRMVGMKLKYFQQTASTHLNGCIQSAIPEDLRKTLQGKSTVVRILYQEDGTLKEILFDSGSDDPFIQLLKDGIQWDALNAPRKFGLPFREIKVRIGLDAEGKPSSRITLL
jgi:hypothetical protein